MHRRRFPTQTVCKSAPGRHAAAAMLLRICGTRNASSLASVVATTPSVIARPAAATRTAIPSGTGQWIQRRSAAHGFQPFTESDEEQLVKILSASPRHIGRHVRQMMMQTRKKAIVFRSTGTYLMVVLQQQLQSGKISPSVAAEVLESVMKEAVRHRQTDMAHLLFRAGLRFKKYGLKLTLPCLRALFDSYVQRAERQDVMKALAEELKDEPGFRPLAIAAYIFAGLPVEAAALRNSISDTELSVEDFEAMALGYAGTLLFDNLFSLAADAKAVHSKNREFDIGRVYSTIIEKHHTGRRYPRHGSEERTDNIVKLYKEAVQNRWKLTDAAVSAYLDGRLSTVKSATEAYAVEVEVCREMDVEALGLASAAKVVGKAATLLSLQNAKGDAVMFTKVEHLRTIVEAQITNQEWDSIEQDHLTSLLRGYGALGKYDELDSAFDMISQHPGLADEMVYAELMNWYSRSQNVKKALQLKEKMDEHNIYVSNQCYGHLLTCVNRYYPRSLVKIYEEIKQRGRRIDPRLYGVLIQSFVRVRNDEVVAELFRSMLDRTNKGDEGLFNQYSLSTLLTYATKKQDRKLGEQVIALAADRGFTTAPKLQAALLNYYSAFGMFDELKKFLDSMPSRSPETYGALLQNYVRTGDKIMFEKTIEAMRRNNVQFGGLLFGRVLHAYASWGDVEKVKGLLQEAKNTTVLPESAFYLHATKVLSKLGDTAAVDQLWEDCRDSGKPASMETYNSFLEVFMTRNQTEKMQEVLQNMMEHIPPNPVTTTTIIDMLGKMGRLQEMDALLNEMCHNEGNAPTLVTYHAVMAAYARLGDITKLEETRVRIKQDDLNENAVTFNILFDGYGRAKRYEHVKELLQERESRGIPLEETGFLVLLNIFGRGRLAAEVDNIVEKILGSELELSPKLLSGMVSAYGHVNDLAKVSHYAELVLKHPRRSVRQVESLFLVFAKLKDGIKLNELLKTCEVTEFAYNICVGAFAKMNEHMRVAELLAEMDEKKMSLSTNTSMTLSSLLLKAGHTELAHAVLHMQKKDIRGAAGSGEEAVNPNPAGGTKPTEEDTL